MSAIPPLGPQTPRRGNAVTRGIGRLGLRLLGWRLEGPVPDVPRFVAIVAPHTSNWDFLVGLAALLALGLRGRFLAKQSLFRGPFGAFLRWVSGIPVDRARAGGVVEQAVAALNEGPPTLLAITPEGTRKRVARWKTGFHRIARQAAVPIWPVAFDYSTKTMRFHPTLEPGPDMEADVARLQSHFEAGMALRPEGYGVDRPLRQG